MWTRETRFLHWTDVTVACGIASFQTFIDILPEINQLRNRPEQPAKSKFESNSLASNGICNLQILKCHGCHRCRRCRRALPAVARRLSSSAQGLSHRSEDPPGVCRSSVNALSPSPLSRDAGSERC